MLPYRHLLPLSPHPKSHSYPSTSSPQPHLTPHIPTPLPIVQTPPKRPNLNPSYRPAIITPYTTTSHRQPFKFTHYFVDHCGAFPDFPYNTVT